MYITGLYKIKCLLFKKKIKERKYTRKAEVKGFADYSNKIIKHNLVTQKV